MGAKKLWKIFKGATKNFIDDDVFTLSAAVSFYTALSFAPMLLIIVAVAGLLGPDAQESVVNQFTSLMGAQAGETVKTVLSNAEEQPSTRSVAGWVGIGMLLFAATTVFAQLQYSLNVIWNVKARPDAGWGMYFRKRLLSLGMIFTIGFLLVVSLIASAAIQMVLGGEGAIWKWTELGVSIVVFGLLFAAMFKILPDVSISWHNVWFGAFATAVLFAVGKFGIGYYLGKGSVGSAYGAAGSLLVLLVWVYYSSLILFFGAELTQMYARVEGTLLKPDKHAIWADKNSDSKVGTPAAQP